MFSIFLFLILFNFQYYIKILKNMITLTMIVSSDINNISSNLNNLMKEILLK